VNRKNVQQYFGLLKDTMIENYLIDHPGHIYNMDETGLQIINRGRGGK
jgi:hypothetical protein